MASEAGVVVNTGFIFWPLKTCFRMDLSKSFSLRSRGGIGITKEKTKSAKASVSVK